MTQNTLLYAVHIGLRVHHQLKVNRYSWQLKLAVAHSVSDVWTHARRFYINIMGLLSRVSVYLKSSSVHFPFRSFYFTTSCCLRYRLFLLFQTRLTSFSYHILANYLMSITHRTDPLVTLPRLSLLTVLSFVLFSYFIFSFLTSAVNWAGTPMFALERTII